jgi:phage tail-like protein
VKIIVIDESGADKASFLVSEAWPTKYDPSDLNGKGNEVFIELLELVNEGIERTR